MSTHAKYGWAIGLIVAGIVGALPFRNTNPGSLPSDQVAQTKSTQSESEQKENPSGEAIIHATDGDQKKQSKGNRKSLTKNSRLLPNASKSLAQFDDIKQPGNSLKSESHSVPKGQIVEQVPRKLDRDQLPNSINKSTLADNSKNRSPAANQGAVELDDPPVRNEMPRTVGPYRMRPVPSSKFRNASQSGGAPAVSNASRSRRVVHYKLRDGDSLRSIAKRYLGDENRYEEILADNRHLLTNGERFLPVGQYITIIVQ